MPDRVAPGVEELEHGDNELAARPQGFPGLPGREVRGRGKVKGEGLQSLVEGGDMEQEGLPQRVVAQGDKPSRLHQQGDEGGVARIGAVQRLRRGRGDAAPADVRLQLLQAASWPGGKAAKGSCPASATPPRWMRTAPSPMRDCSACSTSALDRSLDAARRITPSGRKPRAGRLRCADARIPR